MNDLGIRGVRLLQLGAHLDERGFFTEIFRSDQFPESFLQANRSQSREGVLRGLHFHRHQADLWHVVSGRALVNLVDLRGKDHRPRCASVVLDGVVPSSLFIPPGVAHGFRALSDVELIYWVTHEYDASDEWGLAWDDPALGLGWGPGTPVLSERDSSNQRLDWEQIPGF